MILFHYPKQKDIKTNDVLYTIVNKKSGIGYMDLTGRFLYQTSWWNIYIIIAYNYDANVTLVEIWNNKHAVSIATAWTTINKKITMLALNPAHTSWTTDVPEIYKLRLQKTQLISNGSNHPAIVQKRQKDPYRILKVVLKEVLYH